MYQARKREAENDRGIKMTNIVEFASNAVAEGNTTWTFVCVCKKCESKIKMVRVHVSLLPAVAQKFGYSNELTATDFKRMNHLMVQANG